MKRKKRLVSFLRTLNLLVLLGFLVSAGSCTLLQPNFGITDNIGLAHLTVSGIKIQDLCGGIAIVFLLLLLAFDHFDANYVPESEEIV